MSTPSPETEEEEEEDGVEEEEEEEEEEEDAEVVALEILCMVFPPIVIVLPSVWNLLSFLCVTSYMASATVSRES